MTIELQCRYCGCTILYEKPLHGRPRKYCGPAHARAAWREEHPTYQARYQRRYRLAAALQRILAMRRA
jgi:hypothetical protein